MSDRFKGKRIVLTGAGSPLGIGFATANLFAKEGADLFVISTTDRIEERAATLRSYGNKAFGYATDLSVYSNVAKAMEVAQEKLGGIDVLVNNAGMATLNRQETFSDVATMDLDDWQHQLGITLNTCFFSIKAVLPYMQAAKYGRIVNTSSVTGPLVSNPGEAGYAAAKAAIMGLTRTLAIEVAKDGITVNSVAPGWIETGSSTEAELIAGKNTPIGRCGTAEEVGKVITFLASDDVSYVTGQMVVIDGGNTLQEYKGPSEFYY